jgi:hypothetical protein
VIEGNAADNAWPMIRKYFSNLTVLIGEIIVLHYHNIDKTKQDVRLTQA